MPDYRRASVPGGTYFFTVVTYQRHKLFCQPRAIALLGSMFRRFVLRWPMRVDALILLPDHFHTIWTLPPADCAYSMRLGWVKKEFTKHWLATGGDETRVTSGITRERRRGIWQPRFWEHTIQDEDDFQHHFDYIHWNPVKHGYVQCPKDWPHSSFHRWVKKGVYPEHWGCYTRGAARSPLDPSAIKEAGEP
ncbi:transposase [Roseiconus nitratireducens]|uniref:Transposase n=1 Tax=Roseiconus nitratireducens TaxID=2605748 RepID=A0A5M6DEP9_9BACT|nr:transposase [Roseiconus nitratireducens]KAA5544659.1 transposase [Roseiconus nitratireducens]